MARGHESGGVMSNRMGMERRDHQQRAETLRRIVMWISGETTPGGQVPRDIADAAAGQRILKTLALRGLVRNVGRGWLPHRLLVDTPPTREAPIDELSG